ncbi:hypothetical protein [uncultured Desulfovibrio sp.]|uniref:hypothetical protein n=1 Tax=uncultured Desulfovibrio sp. TaxID=167968 RepID=UPI002621473C|nr:hypothetical protein [uncultured Desulfovibrio sp.]
MGMEISSRRLQEADSRVQSGHAAPEQHVDDADREHFDRAMERRNTGEQGNQGGQGDSEGGDRQASGSPSPQALLDSLFGSRMQGLQPPTVQTDAAMARTGEVDALVEKLVERILVSEPGRGAPEVRLTLGQGSLAGAELSLSRAQDGQLFIRLSCADAASFQTAVGAQDALRHALERNGETVRVEISQQTEGGQEGDARRQSRGRQEYMPDQP